MATDYGTDVAASSDGLGIDPFFSLVTGAQGVAQALARRLITPQGGLITDPTYGFDLRALVNTSLSQADILAIQSGVRTQCLYDERVDSVDVQVELDSGVATVLVSPVLVEGETFTLTFQISLENSGLVYQGVTWPDGSVSS